MSATNNAISLLEDINKKADYQNELQSTIAPDVFFKRCSVNLLIGKRGSGKTYNVFRELIKLNWVPERGGYDRFLYVCDKESDPTFERVKKLIPLKIYKCTYADAAEYIEAITRIAAEEKTKYHTLVLLDDAQDILVKRTKANKDLYRKLFENRQPRITYMITLQDAIGINSAMKENSDALWLFGGFSRSKFMYALKYVSHETDDEDLWQIYVTLSRNQAMLFNVNNAGTALTIITK